MQDFGAFELVIGGRRLPLVKSMPVVNPATGEAFAQAPDCTREELDLAVQAARDAFPGWASTPIEERQQAVRKLGQIIVENVESLKQIFTAEQGKPLTMAAMELQYAAMWCEGAATMSPPVTILEDSDDRRIEVTHPPIGVVGGIIPWNFPVMLAAIKFAPALVAGCALVLKPSPFTPLTMLRIAELAQAVLPPGVFNVVTGGDDLGPWMTSHPRIDKISFTGSSATGERVMESAAKGLKRLTLELGGNDPAIVLPDVNPAEVAPNLFWAAFQNSSQFCLATKRVYIHADIYDAVRDAMIAYARHIVMGNGAEENVFLGPIQNRPQFERVRALIADAKNSGLVPAFEGETPQCNGFFVPVTIFDNPPEDSPVVTEEAFGPVVPLLKFTDIDDVVARANDTLYGLGGSVWSNDWQAAKAVADRLQCGFVWINEIHYQTPFTPLAGWKRSGLGAENGIEGLLAYTETRTTCIRKHPPAPMPLG